jgi:hypothetical protein
LDRLRALAADLVEHWENRSAQLVKFIGTPGKALVVGGTREICANLYEEIIKLRPDWHSDALDQGRIKVVYSGSVQDQPPISQHVRRSAETRTIQNRLRDPDDDLQIVIVKDMLLTGFDAPPLHTLYLDRPLKGALLMQTLARVNRTFRGKPAGLLVAYAPLVDNLTKALAEYTDDQATKPVGKATDEAVALVLAETLMTELDQVCAGFDWRSRLDGGPRSWVRAAVGLTDYLRSPQTPGNQVREGEESLGDRFRKLANQLARTWALFSGSETWNDLRRRDARFYEEVRVWMGKFDAQERRLPAGRYRRKSSGCCRHWWPRRPLPVTSSISTRQPASRGRALRSSAPTSRPGRRRRPTRTWRSRRYGTAGRGVRQGDPAQPGPPAGLLGTGRRADAPVYQPASSRLPRSSPSWSSWPKRQLPNASGVAGSPRRCPTTSWPSMTRSAPMSPRYGCRARACWPRSPATWSGSCSGTSRPTGPPATTYAPS